MATYSVHIQNGRTSSDNQLTEIKYKIGLLETKQK